MNSVAFDVGRLIAVEGNDRRVLALLARAKERRMPITIPSTALAQVMRNPSRQARLTRLIRQTRTHVVHLDGLDATAVGTLLARPSSDGHDS